MQNAMWYLKQLVPLKYRTYYGDSAGTHFVEWRMFLGRCFAVNDTIISNGPIRLEA